MCYIIFDRMDWSNYNHSKTGGNLMINIKVDNSKKCNGEYSLFLSFQYDTSIIDVVRSLPSRFWDAENKTWEVPFNKLSYLLNELSEHPFNITGKYIDATPKKVEAPVDFNFKTEPYKHQVECFKYGLEHDKFLLGDEMGLGKTKQVIDIAVAKKAQRGYQHCLIVCGVNGLKWNWRNEVSTHSNENGYILGTRGNKIGSNADKLADVKNLKNDTHNYFIITNVESLRDEAICTELSELCKSGVIGMIAFDECHKCKNPSTQQGKAILKLQAETMIAMTGTPLMNVPQDLYIILKWLGFEKHAFYSFKNHYCIMGGYGGYEIVGYKNLEELQERLNDIMLRRLKKDILDLPEKTYIDEYVEMSAKQAVIYKEVQQELKANIDELVVSSNPLAQLIRLRQATGYTGILSSMIQESAKLDRMEELVEEAVQNGKQVVIFSNWTQMTDAIYERLNGKYAIGSITGQTNDESRQQIVDMFQNKCFKVLIGTSGAMGTGLTLTAGSVEIFVDEPWNMALKEQCVDRCHRIGQNSNLTIYTLMCKDTIDERIHQIVERKGKMADALVDGKIDMDKRELLQFLLD